MSLSGPGNPRQERAPRRQMENGAAGTVLLLYSTLGHPHGEHCVLLRSLHPKAGARWGEGTEKGN